MKIEELASMELPTDGDSYCDDFRGMMLREIALQLCRIADALELSIKMPSDTPMPKLPGEKL